MISFPIVFEDNEVIILNKPAGIVVSPSETTKEKTVSDLVLSHLCQPAPGVGERAGIVHRLDKDTSGLLIVAKTEEAFRFLQRQFKDRTVEKEYIALVHGSLPEKGEISAPILRNPFNRKKFGIFPGGRNALTYYTVIDRTNAHGESLSLLRVRPLTGRTHQIRVHLKYIGHPIVSDKLYGGRKMVRADLQFCPRLFLHASRISFLHPRTAEKITFSSELPVELKNVLVSLQRQSN